MQFLSSNLVEAEGLAHHTSIDLAYKGQYAQMNVYSLLLVAQQLV